jgi:hypothetical protein
MLSRADWRLSLGLPVKYDIHPDMMGVQYDGAVSRRDEM